MITIKSNSRVALVGATGTGKTFLARYMLQNVTRLLVLDPKSTLRGRWGLDEWTNKSRRALYKGEPLRARVSAEPGESGLYESVLFDAYHAGNVLIYIDEVYGIAPVGTRPGEYLTAVYTRGRELGVGVVAATQRPAWVPLFIFSEADSYILFRLKLEADKRRMAEFMGAEVLEPITDPHGFWVYQNDWITAGKPAQYFKRLHVRKPKN